MFTITAIEKKFQSRKNYQSTFQFKRYHQDGNTAHQSIIILGAQLHQCLSTHSVVFPRSCNYRRQSELLLFQ